MSGLRFEKYEGLGNDFVLVELQDETALGPEAARALCDRHYGIGADGVLLVLPASKGAAGRMLVLNADGSRPEMCGNGLRCVALHLHRRGAGEAFVVETDAGPRQCRMLGSNVEIGLGRGTRLPQHVADFDGARVPFDRISMGNPHAVTFDAPVPDAAIDRFGQDVSRSIEGGSNVEFATTIARGDFQVVVWERGVGRTLACGTGAGATAVSAVLEGRADHGVPLRVGLPGGALELVVSRELEVLLRGPARHVFSGEVRSP